MAVEGAFWFNQVELFFSALTRRVVQHGGFTSRDDLIEKLEAYVIGHNETTRPYRWTYEDPAQGPLDQHPPRSSAEQL